MITIHEKSQTNFNSLGFGVLLPSSCYVKEELNGIYELELTHPYDPYGKWKYIENDRIIYASTPRGNQAFRVYRVLPNMDGITVNAKHIFYDLLDNFIVELDFTGTASSFLDTLKTKLAYPMNFNFNTDISTSDSLLITSRNPIQALFDNADDKNSFIKSFGGELLRDKFNVSMLASVGSDRGVQIRYSKNLIGLEIDEDISGVITRVYPKGKEGLKLPEQFIDSPKIGAYTYPKIFEFEDTECETVEDLRASANKFIGSGVDLPMVNIKADFQLLSKTVEYKEFAVLETVYIGDVVTVINKRMEFNKKAKVISYEWDCLAKKYTEVELGDFVADLTSGISTGEKAINTATSASTEAKQVMGLLSGNITVRDNYLYISIDSTDYTASPRVFRWGKDGLEYTSTGVSGKWNTLISKDGVVT